MKQHQTNSFISRAAAMLLTVIIAFAGAQTAGAQMPEPKPCKIAFDISSGGTVEFRGETVTNSQTKDCTTPSDDVLTITPKTGYVVSSVTYDATEGLSISLKQKDDFHWSLNIPLYGGSDTPTITVHIVFDKGLAGGADEASAVALTADDDLSHLTGGWYKVESDLTFGHTVNLHGDTHITIATGATLTVSTSDEYGISGSALTVSGEGTLAVSASNRAIYVDNYTQTGCAVTLSGSSYGLHAKNNVSISGGSLTTSGADYGIGSNEGAITISGGTVSSSGKQCGLYATKAMNITGGTVNASGNVGNGIRGYSVSIMGGQVTVSSGGIMSNYGDITLGCTSATDYITASGYVLQNDGFYVKIADGQTLYGGGFPSASYTGTIVDPSALNGLMLRPTAAVTKSGTNEYTIWNADGWDAFCDMLEAGESFSGKTIVLAGDIGTPEDPVTRMGSSTTQFQGTFDGAGHTLTVQYGTASEPVNQQFVAPFPKVAGAATFRNLTIAGSIYSGYATSVDKGTGGLIGCLFGGVTVEHCVSTVTVNAASDRAGGFVGHCEHAVTFTDCVSSATVTCTGSGSGFVGWSRDSKYTIAFYGCLFSGKVLKQGNVGSGNGSFVGWKGFSKTVTITNCIAAPAADENMATDNSATFCRYSADTSKDNGETHITNGYYTQTLGNAQGKARHTVTAGTDVTVAHAGVATHYATSGITAYKATGASADSDPFIAGLLYNNNAVDVLYAGSDEVVSLTLSNTAPGNIPLGYQYEDGDGFTASAGTLSGSTLTMPAADVTVSLALRSTHEPVEVSYVDAGGTPQTAQAIALDGTETGLDEGWYFVGTDIAFDHTLYLSGDVNLILADGCTMNVTSSDANGIYFDGTLTIYGQTDGTGTLNATGLSNGIYTYSGTITISGGRVTATGGNEGIHSDSGNITISGGRVTVTGENGAGISNYSGTITLGCTTASDFIYANRYVVGPGDRLNIADGQTLFDEDGNPYSGTIIDYGDLNGKTLRPGLTARQAPDQNYWTTYYNGTTGFTIDADENACAYTATYGGSQLTLHKLGKEIPAGTAVIIVADNDVVSMTTTDLNDFTGDNDLRGVDADTPTSALGTGTGTFYVLGMTTVNDEQHFGFHRYTGSTMAAHKAYLLVPGSNSARSLDMVFGDGNGSAGVSPATVADEDVRAPGWYTLDGRRLQAKPTAPGIYINNGKKVVIK